ncbi:hypothetical protein NEUTE1DRAFT_61104 [Neurospora tetrasperma FGSC 2508]|uniref:Signal recognition particle subunit SRP68 n=1 Tax=Neurospora tetrasperma (strain FGSC 2508 / ATCC MYA-4615 / P0657) TaxID=510951 RepID=F8MH38_NEUT8|nr:uncharacterized protein NEUTE1DRAFT_61104 [Neurospora tetrasperma FGSC 2508]EGO59554.1 hypothetical protein NEUTE1DRAFT_61104 [Neurospora tetrasperma FGSC 2508]EGZ73686.1 hypothetical protein NEUTE2DRAFT_108535 [Neurospora tetrasperma FGSC 2509]
MDITKFVVSHRENALLYGDYATYRAQLSRKLLNSRKKLNIATKSRGKFHPKAQITAEQISDNHEYLHLALLTAERTWAHAMSMKASHAADTKGMTGKTRSHIVSRLEKGARTAEKLADVLSQDAVSGASPNDILEARAYAALLRGAANFEKQSWEDCIVSYAVARMIYSALSTSTKGDIYKDLLTDTIDPSIRYAAYQAKIPRTQPIPSIAKKAFAKADDDLVDRVKAVNPSVLEQGDVTMTGVTGAEGAPTTITWRSREVKIEDASIAVAWASVQTAKAKLTERLSSASSLAPKDKAAAYDDILAATQDAVDATKQAIDELRGEGVTQSDPRMQSLQITRTAVNFEMISWRIGRNRVLAGELDGARATFDDLSKKGKKAQEAEQASERPKEEAPGRQIAKLKEKVVLYDGTLQSLETITELPGVANDQELFTHLQATSQYFTALKSLAIARSHSLAHNDANALALIRHALIQTESALPILSSTSSSEESSPARNILVSAADVQTLHSLLNGEIQRARALVEISEHNKNKKPSSGSSSSNGKPLIGQLANYPSSGQVNLENIVVYPPRLEAIPVKPIFLDVAWNYIDYPEKIAAGGDKNQQQQQRTEEVQEEQTQEEEKPKKRGWFGFGR